MSLTNSNQVDERAAGHALTLNPLVGLIIGELLLAARSVFFQALHQPLSILGADAYKPHERGPVFQTHLPAQQARMLFPDTGRSRMVEFAPAAQARATDARYAWRRCPTDSADQCTHHGQADPGLDIARI